MKKLTQGVMYGIFGLVVILTTVLPDFALAENADEQVKQEEVMTNTSVIKMVKAKLGDTLIISKIKSSKTNFDLSTDSIIKLKEASVSDKIIEVMMGGGEIPPAVKTEVPQPHLSKPQEGDGLPASGDFFIVQNGKLIVIEEHPGYMKASMAKAIFTGGFAADVWFILDNPKSSLRIPAYKENLVFVSKIKVDPTGTAAPSGDLFRLALKSNKIRYAVLSASITTGSQGIVKKEYKTNYEFKKNQDGSYTITMKEPLSPGEYAFAVSGNSSNPNDSSVRFFDFGVDETSEAAQPGAKKTNKSSGEGIGN